MNTSTTEEPFRLRREVLGALPVIDHFIERMGVDQLLEVFVPHNDFRIKLAPAKALGVVVRNLVLHREPIYALNEWAKPFDAKLLGIDAGDVDLLNDDRVGRSLARLFDSDRASLLNRLVLDVVDKFSIDTNQLHNDSTSVRFAGSYRNANGSIRAGKTTPAILHGHSKDHRPDLKQLVWILTISSDGAVPIACRVANGNVTDDTTHIATWDSLVSLLGRSDFLYVADSKLATKTNMDHIVKGNGRFISVLPATRKEDSAFRRYVVDHELTWVEAIRHTARRKDQPEDLWWTTEAPWPSAEGYRIIWVKSSSKIECDAESRRACIAKAVSDISSLNERLASNKTRIKTIVAVEKVARTIIGNAKAVRWIDFEVTETTNERYRQDKSGRPSNKTRYRKLTQIVHRVSFKVREDVVAADACSDGCFPLVTNQKDLTGAEVLVAYKYQPNLERRHSQLKGVQLVAPVFLKDPARIEGLLCCHFIALVVQALIEREIRNAMADHSLKELSLYPEDRACKAPSAARILEIFNNATRDYLYDKNGELVQIFYPELSKLQLQVLDLLGISLNRFK